MVGIVIVPTDMTLATADPEMVPNSAEVTTATFAGPPNVRPATRVAARMKTLPAPIAISSEPKMT